MQRIAAYSKYQRVPPLSCPPTMLFRTAAGSSRGRAQCADFYILPLHYIGERLISRRVARTIKRYMVSASLDRGADEGFEPLYHIYGT